MRVDRSGVSGGARAATAPLPAGGFFLGFSLGRDARAAAKTVELHADFFDAGPDARALPDAHVLAELRPDDGPAHVLAQLHAVHCQRPVCLLKFNILQYQHGCFVELQQNALYARPAPSYA